MTDNAKKSAETPEPEGYRVGEAHPNSRLEDWPEMYATDNVLFVTKDGVCVMGEVRPTVGKK